MPRQDGPKRDWRNDPLDIDYLLDSGLLFEANRQFFHPLGLAITVKVDEQGKKSWSFKDHRECPEKAVFDKNVLEIGRNKFERFMAAFGFAQMDKRQKKLGKTVQHVEQWT